MISVDSNIAARPDRVDMSAPAWRTVRRRARVCGYFAGAWLFAMAATAQENAGTDIDVARQLFREATELAEAHEWNEAASKLRQAIAIKDTPGLRFHLAHAEAMLGHLVEAQLEYERADELIARGSSAPDVERLLGPAKESLRDRVPTIVLRVKDVAEPSLAIDGKATSTALFGTAIPLNPGKHKIVVSSPKHAPFEIELLLAEGQDRSIEAVLEPLASGSDETTSPARAANENTAHLDASSGFGAREGVLIAEAGIALAGLGIGVFYFLEAGSAEDRIRDYQDRLARDACHVDSPGEMVDPDCARLRSAIDDHDTATTLSTIGFVAAGVGAAAAVGTFLLWPTREDASGPRVGFAVTPRGAMSSLTTRF